MNDEPKWKVGQTVLFIPSYGGTSKEVTVTKVARTRLTVDHGYGRPEQYHMANGRSVKDFGGRIVTLEEHAENQRRTKALDTLRQRYGLSFSGARCRELPAGTFEAILELLQRGAA